MIKQICDYMFGGSLVTAEETKSVKSYFSAIKIPLSKSKAQSERAKRNTKKPINEPVTEVWKNVGEKYGLDRGKPNSQAVHLDTAEYKAKKIVEAAKQRGAEIDEQTERKQAELTELTQAVEQATDKPIPKKKKQDRKTAWYDNRKKGTKKPLIRST